MDLLRTFKLSRLWRREFNRVLRELGTYSDRELLIDLRLPGSVSEVAALGADEHVAAFVRDNPEYRRAWNGAGKAAGARYA